MPYSSCKCVQQLVPTGTFAFPSKDVCSVTTCKYVDKYIDLEIWEHWQQTFQLVEENTRIFTWEMQTENKSCCRRDFYEVFQRQ